MNLDFPGEATSMTTADLTSTFRDGPPTESGVRFVVGGRGREGREPRGEGGGVAFGQEVEDLLGIGRSGRGALGLRSSMMRTGRAANGTSCNSRR